MKIKKLTMYMIATLTLRLGPAFAANNPNGLSLVKRSVTLEGNIDPKLTASLVITYQSADKQSCHYELFEGEVCSPNLRNVTVGLLADSEGRFNATINTYAETGFGLFKERFELSRAELQVALVAAPTMTAEASISFPSGGSGEVPATDLSRLVFDLKGPAPTLHSEDISGKKLSGDYLVLDSIDGTTNLHFEIDEL